MMTGNPFDYHEYKRDTKILAQWLASSSESYGRKPTSGDSGANILTISDFLETAEFLAAQHAFTVPSWVDSTLRRAISLRKAHGLAIKSAQGKDDTEDGKHEHFVRVLERVYDRLQPLVSTPLTISTSNDTSDSLKNTCNRFACLEVSDPSASVDVSSPLQPESTSTARTKVSFEPWKEDAFETFLARVLLLEQLNNLRAGGSKIWRRFRDGTLSLPTVAVVHSVILLIGNGLYEQAEPLLNYHGGFGRLLRDLFHYDYFSQAVDEDDLERRVKLRAENPSGLLKSNYEMADKYMAIVYYALAAFGIPSNTKGIAWYEGKTGPYVPNDVTEEKSDEARCAEDLAILSETLPDIHLLTRLALGPGRLRPWLTLDRLCYAVSDFSASGDLQGNRRLKSDIKSLRIQARATQDSEEVKISPETFEWVDSRIKFPLIFGAQLYLQAVHSLGTELERPGHLFLQQCRQAKKWAERKLERGVHSCNLEHLLELGSLASYFLDDPVAKCRRRQKPGTKIWKENLVIVQCPPLSSFLLKFLRLLQRTAELRISNTTRATLCMARLYDALRANGLLSEALRWEDMELFLHLERKAVWGKERPAPGSYYAHLALCGELPGFSKRSQRFLGPSLPVSRVLLPLLCGERKSLDSSDLDGLIGIAHPDCVLGRDLTEWLIHLADILEQEELRDSFDYGTFDDVCIKIIERLVKPLALGEGFVVELMTGAGVRITGRTWVDCIYLLLVGIIDSKPIRTDLAKQVNDILGVAIRGVKDLVHKQSGVDWSRLEKISGGSEKM